MANLNLYNKIVSSKICVAEDNLYIVSYRAEQEINAVLADFDDKSVTKLLDTVEAVSQDLLSIFSSETASWKNISPYVMYLQQCNKQLLIALNKKWVIDFFGAGITYTPDGLEKLIKLVAEKRKQYIRLIAEKKKQHIPSQSLSVPARLDIKEYFTLEKLLVDMCSSGKIVAGLNFAQVADDLESYIKIFRESDLEKYELLSKYIIKAQQLAVPNHGLGIDTYKVIKYYTDLSEVLSKVQKWFLRKMPIRQKRIVWSKRKPVQVCKVMD